MSKQNEDKNVLTTGGLPTGTYNVEVSSEEIANVDPKVIEEMKKRIKG